MVSRYQDKITAQMKRLGGSFDWDRVAFTMDEVCLQASWTKAETDMPPELVYSCQGGFLPASWEGSVVSRKQARQLVCLPEHESV